MPLDTACITQQTADIAALLDALDVANINLQRKDNAYNVLVGEIRILLAEVASLNKSNAMLAHKEAYKVLELKCEVERLKSEQLTWSPLKGWLVKQ